MCTKNVFNFLCNGLMHSSLCQNNHVFVICAVLVLFAVMMSVLSLHLRTHGFQDCKNLTSSDVQEYYTLVLKWFSGSSRVEMETSSNYPYVQCLNLWLVWLSFAGKKSILLCDVDPDLPCLFISGAFKPVDALDLLLNSVPLAQNVCRKK